MLGWCWIVRTLLMAPLLASWVKEQSAPVLLNLTNVENKKAACKSIAGGGVHGCWLKTIVEAMLLRPAEEVRRRREATQDLPI